MQPANSCQHEHTVLNTTGSLHFYAGDVTDDIQTEVICLDCGSVLSPDDNEVLEEYFHIA